MVKRKVKRKKRKGKGISNRKALGRGVIAHAPPAYRELMKRNREHMIHQMHPDWVKYKGKGMQIEHSHVSPAYRELMKRNRQHAIHQMHPEWVAYKGKGLRTIFRDHLLRRKGKGLVL